MRKILKNVFLALVILSVLAVLTSCGNEEAELPTEADTDIIETEEVESETEPELPTGPVLVTYSPTSDADKFRFVGRMNPCDEGVYWDYAASGIEFCGEIVGDVVLSLSCDRDTYFTVYVDGERADERFFASAEDDALTVASFVELGFHTVKVLRQTEMQWSLAVLESVTVTGSLDSAPADRDILIEFIGDSLTSGYGNLGGQSAPNAGIALYEDATRTYAFLTAESFGADATLISCSGVRLSRGDSKFSALEFYQNAALYRSREISYENNSRVPDLIVINLGANDYFSESDVEDFGAEVRALIEYVRDFYGVDIPIVWAYNMIGEGNSAYMQKMREVIDAMGGEEVGLYYTKLEFDRSGGGAHPSLTGHEWSAKKLVKFITEKGFFE